MASFCCLFQCLCHHNFYAYILAHEVLLLDLNRLDLDVWIISCTHHSWWTEGFDCSSHSKVKSDSKSDSKKNQKNSDSDENLYFQSKARLLIQLGLFRNLGLMFELFLRGQALRHLILALNGFRLKRGFLLHWLKFYINDLKSYAFILIKENYKKSIMQARVKSWVEKENELKKKPREPYQNQL